MTTESQMILFRKLFQMNHQTDRFCLPHFRLENISLSPILSGLPLYHFRPSCVAPMRRCLKPSRPTVASELHNVTQTTVQGSTRASRCRPNAAVLFLGPSVSQSRNVQLDSVLCVNASTSIVSRAPVFTNCVRTRPGDLLIVICAVSPYRSIVSPINNRLPSIST
jgi:hypothetical protein